MNVRKLIARLNCTTVRYDIGQGGAPELTAQDIAGALGMVNDELAREVFCAVWWPDGSRLSLQDLLRLIGLKQRAEIDRQWKYVQMLRLDLHIAEDDLASRRAISSEDRSNLERLQARLKHAQELCWPAQPKMYPVLRLAALQELQEPNLCKSCDGRGKVLSGSLLVECKHCGGSCAVRVSDRQRAARIGRDESTYRREWRAAYEWTYQLLSDAESRAASMFSRCLLPEAA